jgi:hypothetical protein
VTIHTVTARMDISFTAIVHDSAGECAEKYSKVGDEILVRESPVQISEIEPGYYANNVDRRCPLADFLSLYACTLTDHDIVVLTDVKSMAIQPMDELFDAILYPKDSEEGIKAQKEVKHHWMDYETTSPTMKAPTLPSPMRFAPSLLEITVESTLIRRRLTRKVKSWSLRLIKNYGLTRGLHFAPPLTALA